MTQEQSNPNTTRKPEELQHIEAFENAYGYDCEYMKHMFAHAPEALQIFNSFIPMARHRVHAPLDVYYTAKLTAYRYCDCGPCLQLAVRLAQEEGVPNSLIETLVFDKGGLSETLKRTQDFTRACLSNDPRYEDLRTELAAELGNASMVEIGLTISAAQVFPVIKRATGYYKSCSLVTVEL